MSKVTAEENIDITSQQKEVLIDKSPKLHEAIYVKEYDNSCEEMSKIDKIIALKTHPLKLFMFFFICIVTLGLPYILSVWFPKLQLFLIYSNCDIEVATHCGIYCKDKKFYIVNCSEIILPDINDSHLKKYCILGSFKNKLKVFEFKLFGYVYDNGNKSFSSLKFTINSTNEEIHDHRP